jgi:hypothetical protein
MHASVFLIIHLVQVKQVHFMVVAHIRCGQIPAILAHSEGGYGSAPLGQRHHTDALGSLSIPDKNHGLQADLPSGHLGPVRTDAQRHNIVRMPVGSLRLLLASHDKFFTTAKDLLCASIGVQYYSKSRCHVHALLVVVVVQVLAG